MNASTFYPWKHLDELETLQEKVSVLEVSRLSRTVYNSEGLTNTWSMKLRHGKTGCVTVITTI